MSHPSIIGLSASLSRPSRTTALVEAIRDGQADLGSRRRFERPAGARRRLAFDLTLPVVA